MRRVLIVAVAFLAVVGGMAVSASAEIRFGILPRLSAMEMHAMFSPLADYLSKEVGEKVTLVVPKDFDAYKAMVKDGQIDVGFANSLVYTEIKKDVNVEPFAVSVEKKAGAKFRGILITRKDSGIDSIKNLKGKKLIFVDKSSVVYLTGILLLNKAGLDMNKDFEVLPFAKKVDNVTMAVFNKTADAGVIREDDLEKMKDKVDLQQIKILAYTEYSPNWPVFITPKLGQASATKMRAALLKLKPNGTESEKILDTAKLTGFSPVSDKDYDSLRQAVKLVGTL
jgi:phosphonate transport system substrate-binding protein